METLNVEIKRKSTYQIMIAERLLDQTVSFIRKNHTDKKVVLITDDNVKALQKESIDELNALNPIIISIEPGEQSKTRDKKQEIEDIMLKNKYNRDTLIIALGGGIVGDVAGFVASTFNRGIPIIQLPTTLLAMIDSSIGGKTGVNTSEGKNLIGTITQPDAVFIDLNFLKSLPDEEFRNGMAEIIKMAATCDMNLFMFIEENIDNIMSKEKAALKHMIRKTIELKNEIVEKDENEQGLRQLLNFGHTIGHAIEAESNFSIKHGFCVSMGVSAECRIAAILNELKPDDEKRIIKLLERCSLPTRIKQNIETEKLIESMKLDKKTKNQKPRFIILNEIGKTKTEHNQHSFEVDEKIIKQTIEMCKEGITEKEKNNEVRDKDD